MGANPKVENHYVHASSIPAIPSDEYHSTEMPVRIACKKRETKKNLLLPFMGSSRASGAWRFLTPPESALTPFRPLESQGMTRTSSLSLRSLTNTFLVRIPPVAKHN